jgi:hypothetical protein
VHWDLRGPAGTPGTDGINGTNGTNGTNGIDGTSVVFAGYFSGNEHGCPNGGAIYALAGGVNTYVCNGRNGTAALQADGPCFDNTNRYVDCGNGSVTDTVTGLIWLKQWDCLGSAKWAEANQKAAGLKNGDCGGALTDGSAPGDWRLPTKPEWEATVARAVALGCTGGNGPALTDDAGTACYNAGTSSFVGVPAGMYWSSSPYEAAPYNAWAELLANLFPFATIKDNVLSVWPVRGGSR